MSKTSTVTCLVILCQSLCVTTILADSKISDEEPNQTDYLKPIPGDKLKEDLDFLFKTIEEVHPNMYAYTSKEEFSKLCNQLYGQTSRPMTPREFYKAVAPVVASLKNGHTYIEPFKNQLKQFLEAGGTIFPLALHWDGSKLIVVKNYTSATLPIGGTVLTLNGQQAAEVFYKFARCFPAEKKSMNPHVIQQPGLFGWLLHLEYGLAESWTLQIEGIDGAVNTYVVEPIPLAKIMGAPPEPTAENKKNYHKFIAQYDTAVLEINSFGTDLEKFKQFLKEAFQKIQNSDTANLIIDIRENPGGSDLNANVLLEYLTAKPYRQFEEARIKISSQDEKGIAPLRQQNPELFEGKKVGDIITLELPLKTPPDNPIRFTGQTFLLIGLRSFSTSTSFAATIKRFDIGKLIGEETGDPTILYGNIVNVPLPNSALTAAIAGRAFVLAGGRPDGRGVLPDYEVKQKPEDTAKGIDTVLQFTLNLIQQSDPNGVLKKD